MEENCFYLGGIIPASQGTGYRISGFGVPYCVLMSHLPCPENCPDRKEKGIMSEGE